MPDLFKEWLPSIMETKESVIRDELDIKDFNPFMVNRALSLHLDCIFHADTMNRLGHLEKEQQYQYHMAAVIGRRRPRAPWPKKAKNKEIEVLMRHFDYSREKAEQAYSILTPEQVQEIVDTYKDL